MTKRVITHLGLSLIFAFIIALISFLLQQTSIGLHFLILIYLLIFLGQIFYYHFTTYTKIGLTILSFITNFIFWVAELVRFDNLFHNTYIIDNNKITPIILGGILWSVNKLLIDKLYKLLRMNLKSINKLDKHWS